MPFITKNFILTQPVEAYHFCKDEFGWSMSQVQKYIAKRRVIANKEVVELPNQIINNNIEVIIYHPSTRDLKPIFENSEFAVFEKPAFVYSIPPNRACDYSMIDEVKYQFGEDANITHRLDYETSGLMLISKTKEVDVKLKKLFEDRKIIKKYEALVKGKLLQEFTMDVPLVSNSDFSTTKHKIKVAPFGKSASTDFKPIKYYQDLDQTHIELTPHTGRTHQLRVHLFHIFHSIVGDPLYGTSFEIANKYLNNELSSEDRIKNTGALRLMLHSSYLEFELDSKQYSFKSHGLEL